MARPVRVLAVDDSLTMRKLLEVVFAAPAFELTLAVSGSDAIVAASRAPHDIIVMDYVLPDMRGIDICVALSRNDATKSVPIIVTSAKGPKVLDEFKAYASVAGFVPKPFKPAEMRTAVGDALRERAKPEAPVAAAKPARPEPDKQTHAELEKIARALFTALAPTFLKMPEWMGELGNERADRFLARKALTPKLIEGLLEAVQPFTVPPEAPATDLAGSSELVPLFDVFAILARGARTGVLQLTRDAASIQVFFRRGELIGATHSDPAVYLAGLDASAWKLTPELRQRPSDLQRKLAERTASATQEISNLVAGIQAETAESVAAIEEQTHAVEEEAQIVSKAGEALVKIQGESTHSAELIGDITTAAMSQVVVANEAVASVEKVSKLAENARESAAANLQLVQTLDQISRRLSQSMSRFKVAKV